MIVYLNCYVFGEGYTMKYFDSTGGKLEDFSIKSGKMPEWEQRIFTSTGAYLFWGILENTGFGCVRQIETGRRDENGRVCYHNIAFEGMEEEKEKISAILAYAKEHYSKFVKDINQWICYENTAYLASSEMFEDMLEKWSGGFGNLGKVNPPFLAPEGSAEYFLNNTKAPLNLEEIGEIIPFEKIKKENSCMKLFFYCSAPSVGFVLKQINESTGDVLKERKEAARAMDHEAFAVLTRGGASMALFRTESGMCFVAKNIRSEKTDRYGRKKYASIAFEAGEECREMLARFAAWALLDFQKFSSELTDCLEVSDGPQGYSVDVRMLRELLGRFDRKIYRIPSRKREIWNGVANPQGKEKFRFLVLDASLEYFNRSAELEVDERQISRQISNETFVKWNKEPMALAFTEELYQPLPEEEREGENDMAVEKTNYEVSGTETVDTGVKKQSIGQGLPERAKKQNGTGRDSTDRDLDRIDLLDYWWFRIILLAGGSVVVVALILWLRELLVTR